MKKYTLILLSILSVLFFSCEKEQIPGPRGPQGPQGPAGPVGGSDLTTFFVDVTSNDWFYDEDFISYYVDISAPEINENVINNGLVHVHIGNGTGGYEPMPQNYYPDSTYHTRFYYVYYEGGLTVWNTDSDRVEPQNPGEFEFKVVVQEGIAQ
jgi:hypothetical protein